MINDITGTIKTRLPQAIVLNTGALSFMLQVPNSGLFTAAHDQSITVYTHLHWTQDNGPILFGFLTELERTVFLLVISCSGIGPKIGLAILDALGPHSFLDAVQTSNDGALSKVSGIGTKKAEQIILHLKHKVAHLLKSGVVVAVSGAAQRWSTLSEVLCSLNYSPVEISRTLKYLSDTYSQEDISFDKLMRHALSFLSKHKQ